MKLPNAAPDERSTFAAYRMLDKLPLGIGRRIFSGGMRVAAPYFMSIPVVAVHAEPGLARTRMAPRPWTRNHIGTNHAIALCNLAEITMGIVAEATVPASQRWIPKAMSVTYDAKARGTMHAVAELELPAEIGEGTDVEVPVTVTDDDSTTVFTATITIWVTPA